jgi:hypothetical protein
MPVSRGLSTPRRRGRGYFVCKPSCTVGRRPIPAAVSMMCSTHHHTICNPADGKTQHPLNPGRFRIPPMAPHQREPHRLTETPPLQGTLT